MTLRVAELAAELGISETLLAGRGLQLHAEATELEIADTDAAGRGYLLRPDAAAAWRALKAAAANDGITLSIYSAFRPLERQAELIRRKLAQGQAIADILRVLAPPGYSEHHSGRAIDIATPGAVGLDAGFELTPAYAWLTRHAARFGFILSYPRDNPSAYQYEPWHWCFADDPTPPPEV